MVDLSWGSRGNVLNLSKLFYPTVAQVCLLERGLSFIARPNSFDREELRRDLQQYHRRLKIIDYFQEEDFHHVPFTFPSRWEPEWQQLNKPIRTLIKRDREILRQYGGDPDRADSLKPIERQELQQLQNNPNIIIKPADKGSKIVIMDRQQYSLEAHRQLDNTKYYKNITDSIQPQSLCFAVIYFRL